MGGIRYISQMLIGNSWKSNNEIRNEIENRAGIFFDYEAVTNAVKREWKNLVTLNDNNEVINTAPTKVDKVSDVAENIFKLSNKAYRETLLNRRITTVCSVGFWNRKYDTDILNYFEVAITASNESSLRLHHLKILHNIYPTNILLYKMNIKTTNKCDYCKMFDFIELLFIHCQKLQAF